MKKTLASAIFAAAILIVGTGWLDQAWSAPAMAQAAMRAGGRGGPGPRGGWGGPRGGWAGPRGGWGGPRWGWGGPRVWWGGGAFGWGVWGPGVWWGPGWSGFPAYPYPPAGVVQPSPQTFIEQAPPVAAQPPAPTYWYYCADSKTYYPYVTECPAGWMTVVPSAPSSPQ